MIRFQITGTMQIDAEQPGVYTTSRHPDDDGMVLVAADPLMEIRTVTLRFGTDGLAVDAECVFTHQIGTVTKRDSITFYLTPAVLAAAILPKAAVSDQAGDNPSAADWYTLITNAIAPGIVDALTDSVTATPI
jgi:hypothetical protein